MARSFLAADAIRSGGRLDPHRPELRGQPLGALLGGLGAPAFGLPLLVQLLIGQEGLAIGAVELQFVADQLEPLTFLDLEREVVERERT